MAHGAVHWSECITRDVDAAKAYYSAILGWTFDEMAMEGGGTYWVAMHGGQPVGGMMGLDQLPEGIPPHWMTYLEVSDMDAAIDAAKQSGGRVEREPFFVAEVGTVAMIADPGGALAGFVQPPDRAAA